MQTAVAEEREAFEQQGAKALRVLQVCVGALYGIYRFVFQLRIAWNSHSPELSSKPRSFLFFSPQAKDSALAARERDASRAEAGERATRTELAQVRHAAEAAEARAVELIQAQGELRSAADEASVRVLGF